MNEIENIVAAAAELEAGWVAMGHAPVAPLTFARVAEGFGYEAVTIPAGVILLDLGGLV